MFGVSAKIMYKVTFVALYYGGTIFFGVADVVNLCRPNTIKMKRTDIPAPRGYRTGT